ncbi:MAG: hypothetical protein ACUVRY_00385 [Thermoanaerobaculaceae bacterium]
MRKLAFVFLFLAGSAAARELTSAYMIPAAANKAGKGGTDWHTDLTLVNPHNSPLPIVLYFLPSDTDNSDGAAAVDFTLRAGETLNLWDVLGPNGFDVRGQTGALLVAADTEVPGFSCMGNSCDFAVFSRTYTLGPLPGEFGQGLPGFPLQLGLDRSVLAYVPQLFNDQDFRTNLGVASASNGWVLVGVDLQLPNGEVVQRDTLWIPPFGHKQWPLQRTVTGATAVFYILSGAQEAMLFPYASVVNEKTGDPTYVEAHMTVVGVSAQGLGVRAQRAGSLILPPRVPVNKTLDRRWLRR